MDQQETDNDIPDLVPLVSAAAIFPTSPYAKRIAAFRRVRWAIDSDVIRGRRFDLAHKFLPDGQSLADKLAFLSAEDRRWLSPIQPRT